MGETDTYRAEIEATLAQLDETISSMRQKAELHGGMAKGVGQRELAAIESQMQQLRDMLDRLDQTPEDRQEGLKKAIESFSGDLNAAVRKAWAYYK